ncbi:hypothetical protein ACMGGS_06025 [Superficieibacter sp. BNK-5]|uniref:hypothetical protein n=1 Tax=Superficieibacter sp. BNK-5 TaxID=3376142 RepID=UPI0039BF5E32
MDIIIHTSIKQKIEERHHVTEKEVEECFLNRDGNFLYDTREKNNTIPPTQWFIAETNKGRALKICFVQTPSALVLKTAYEPNETESHIYQKYAF